MQVLEQLSCRLKLGGVWYTRGDVVELDPEDAEAYRLRGLSSPAPAGAVAKNRATVPAAQVGLVTKAEGDETGDTAPTSKPTETVKVHQHGKRPR